MSSGADEDMGYADNGGNDYNNDYNDDYNGDYGVDAGMDTDLPDDPPQDDARPESPSRPAVKAECIEEPPSTSKSEQGTGVPQGDVEAPTPTANRTVQQLVRCCTASALASPPPCLPTPSVSCGLFLREVLMSRSKIQDGIFQSTKCTILYKHAWHAKAWEKGGHEVTQYNAGT